MALNLLKHARTWQTDLISFESSIILSITMELNFSDKDLDPAKPTIDYVYLQSLSLCYSLSR